MEKFRLDIYETKEVCTFNSNLVGLKESLETIDGSHLESFRTR